MVTGVLWHEFVGPAGDPLVLTLSLLSILGTGAGIVVIGRYLARGEQRFLLDFLGDTIGAREPPAGAG